MPSGAFRQNFADAGPQAFLTAFELFEDIDPPGQATSANAQVFECIGDGRSEVPKVVLLAVAVGKSLAGEDEAALEVAISVAERFQDAADRAEFSGLGFRVAALAVAVALKLVELRLRAASLAREGRRPADEVKLLVAAVLNLLAQGGQIPLDCGGGRVQFDHPAPPNLRFPFGLGYG